MKYIGILTLFILIFSCVPVPENNQEEVSIDLSDPDIQMIYSLQDQRDVDSLKLFFNHGNASVRYLATMSMASVQSEESLTELSSLLFDKNDKIKSAAAYAIGQIGTAESVPTLLEAFDTEESTSNSELNMNILDAVGKCGDTEMLDLMATVSNYTLEDTLLLLGQVRGIYRFGRRGIISEKGTARMADILINSAFPNEVRRIAANYFKISNVGGIDQYQFQFLQVLAEDPDPNIRMCIGKALSNTNNEEVLALLLTSLKTEKNDLVKINTIQSLGKYTQLGIADSLLIYIQDNNTNVALAAVDVIEQKATRALSRTLREEAVSTVDTELRGALLRAALVSTPFSYVNTRAVINNQIEADFENTNGDYKKSFFLSALAGDPSNYKKVLKLSTESNSPVVKSLVFQHLSKIISSPNFNNIFRTRRARTRVKSDILTHIRERIATGDVGEISSAGEFLSAQASEFNEVFADSLAYANQIHLLEGASKIEAKQLLQNALSALTTYTYTPTPIENSNPLDWSVLKNISDKPISIIVTTKGKITVELMPTKAPATVANFISLTDKNYYDQKYIHRVVPSFVIQGGCPRGDGYGSLDYTIRSEFPNLNYDSEGYIGMASAGKDTESVQWFITQSPTPHLDGKYTIFGKVKEGMDVVNSIRVGDIIQDIRVLKYN